MAGGAYNKKFQCFLFGDPESHKKCKANEALTSNTSQSMDDKLGEKINFASNFRIRTVTLDCAYPNFSAA